MAANTLSMVSPLSQIPSMPSSTSQTPSVQDIPPAPGGSVANNNISWGDVEVFVQNADAPVSNPSSYIQCQVG